MNFMLEDKEAIVSATKPIEISFTEIQDKVFSNPRRYVVFCKGRRCGGTYGAAAYVVEQMLEGDKKVLWVDTVQVNLTKYYERYFAPLLKNLDKNLWSWNEQKKTLKVLTSFMDMRSAERPENIEGFAYSHMILNEAGIILRDRYLWDNALRPMTLDYQAKVYFVGTPKGKRDKTGQEHLYYTFFKRGQDPINFPDWKSYQVSSYENPFLNRQDIIDLEAEVPALIRDQEIHAKFIDISEDSIFRDNWWKFCIDLPRKEDIQLKVLSLDTAFKTGDENDYTAGTMWVRTGTSYICFGLLNERLTFPMLIEKVRALHNEHNFDIILIEDKASGQSLIQMFQNTTLPVMPFKSDTDKITRAIAITPLVEGGKVFLVQGPWNKTLIDQCAVFPVGEYDDLVDSMSQCLNYLKTPVPLTDGRRPISRRVITTSKMMEGY